MKNEIYKMKPPFLSETVVFLWFREGWKVVSGAMGPRLERWSWKLERWSQGWSDRSGKWSDGAKAGAIEVEIGAMEHRLER